MKTVIGYVSGVKKLFRKLQPSDLRLGATVYGRHYQYYSKGFIAEVVSDELIKVKWPQVAPSHPPVTEKVCDLAMMVEE
jgi:hypothetical protein